MDSNLFRSKFDEIRETFFSHDSFVINDEDDDAEVGLSNSNFQPQISQKPSSMKEIKLRRQLAKARSTVLLKAIKSRKRRVCSRIDSIQSTAVNRDLMYRQSLETNLEVSDRRLQELIFECLGEYEKARARAVRRSVHLSSTIDEKLEKRSEDHQWSFFLSKLEEEFPNFTFDNINSLQMTVKYSELCNYFSDITCNRDDIGGSGRSPKVTRIIQISHRSGRAPRKRRDNSNIVSKLLSCDSNIGNNLIELLSGAIPASKEVEDTSDQNFSTSTLMSSRPLLWLLLSPPNTIDDYHGLTLANCRIYFHVEGRQGGGGTMADAITEYYGGDGQCELKGGRLAVSGALGEHRSSAEMVDCPDVLVHKSQQGDTHHFAVATVQQLMETKYYAETVTRSKKYVLEHLYIAVSGRGQSKEATTSLVSVPKELMLVLLDTYTSRPSRSTPLPSASSIIPSCCVDVAGSYCCLVRNPNYHPTIDVCEDEESSSPYSFVFQFEQDEGEAERPVSVKSKNQWDSNILWNFCRWRSCMAPATSSPAPRYLCTHHSLLKHLLESTTKKKNESARFLPRKPPTFAQTDGGDGPNNDLKMIKAASSLVEELVDDKLAGTIDSFCHRVSSEHGLMRQKHCSRFNPRQVSEREPAWKRWGDPGMLERTLREMEHNKRAASTCLDLEYATTAEIQSLTSCPVTELALIQKELQDSDLFDVASTQRKFGLISSLVHHANA